MSTKQRERGSPRWRRRPGKPTSPSPESPHRLQRSRALRRAGIAVLAVFVLLGFSGLFGSKTSRVTTESGGYALTVTYPRTTRPGLPVRWEYEVRHPGGFDGKIEVSTSFDYLHLFDVTGIQPDATSQTATASEIVWEFDPPPGDVFRVSFDAATEVGIHENPLARVRVVTGGHQVAQARFRTVVIP